MRLIGTFLDETVARLERTLPKGLFAHCQRVNTVATEMAPQVQCDRDLAGLAAWVHDICRAQRGDRLLARARDFSIPVSPLEERLPLLLHGPVGAEVLRREWGITDPQVLSAIWYHTTGRASMGLLERVLFLADKLEPQKDRAYPFNPRVRAALEERGLDEALLEWFTAQLSAFLSHGDHIHPLMVEARNSLLMEKERRPRG
jgi:predicted HD superfamily hydrolase involved in NAD metabolism